MDDLTKWLAKQLDEDERIARAAHAPNWSTDGRRGVYYGVEDSWMTDALTTADADHIAAHDPARVLREIDAKRQIVECHEPWTASNGDIICGRCGREHIDGRTGSHFPCQTLRLLALPYADRPGYKEAWKS